MRNMGIWRIHEILDGMDDQVVKSDVVVNGRGAIEALSILVLVRSIDLGRQEPAMCVTSMRCGYVSREEERVVAKEKTRTKDYEERGGWVKSYRAFLNRNWTRTSGRDERAVGRAGQRNSRVRTDRRRVRQRRSNASRASI